MIRTCIGAAVAAISLAAPATAQAPEESADPEGVRIVPILEVRARYEAVDQGVLDADALTLRLRAGAEVRFARFSLLAEGEGTVAPIDDYNAFAFPLPGESQRRPQYAAVADPENAELNRLQLQYRARDGAITLGRQRINLDDQRWVGSVGWRQNEQTFDGLRGEARSGPVGVDVTYAISQRSIFGEDAGPRTALDGDFLFAGLSSRSGGVQGKLFAYLLDYDEDLFLANSSQTYGGNPFDYAADYWALEGGTTLAGFTIAARWEQLGSDNGRSVQTPMATLHKFNGWADLFLATPPAGLDDAYVSIGRNVGAVGPLREFSFQLTFHQFDSAAGNVEYGTEWDASVGFGLGPLRILLKYADYDAAGFGSNTRKLWLQAEWSL